MKAEIRRTPWFNKDGYRACTAYYSDGTRTTIHEHRELMEAHLGRAILEGYVVHHKNEVRDDNRIDNLEEKLNGVHSREHRSPPEIIEHRCLECGTEVPLLARQVRRNQGKQGKAGPFCGRSCAGRWSTKQPSYRGRKIKSA